MKSRTHFVEDHIFETTVNGKTITLDTGSGKNAGQSPVEVLLSAVASCSSVDVIEILRKKRRRVEDLIVDVEGERITDAYPRIFTKIHLHFTLVSPDASDLDFEQAVNLSIDKYCTVAGMLSKAAEIETSREIRRS